MSATPEREQADVIRRSLADLRNRIPDWTETEVAIESEALAAVSRLEAERDEAAEELAEYTTPLEYACGYEDGKRAAEAQATAAVERERELTRALADEVQMAEQSARTLRDLKANWRDIIEEEIEGEPLIENILYWLIEDVEPTQGREALAGGVSAAGRPPEQALEAKAHYEWVEKLAEGGGTAAVAEGKTTLCVKHGPWTRGLICPGCEAESAARAAAVAEAGE